MNYFTKKNTIKQSNTMNTMIEQINIMIIFGELWEMNYFKEKNTKNQ